LLNSFISSHLFIYPTIRGLAMTCPLTFWPSSCLQIWWNSCNRFVWYCVN